MQQDSRYDNVFYKVPDEIGLSRRGVPEGFELIAKADRSLSCEARLESTAKYKLAALAERFGANVVIDYTVERFVRNSIGFSFYMYRATGTAAVMGQESDEGTFTRGDLEGKLDLKGIEDHCRRMEQGKKGAFYLKLFCALLFVTFLLGFIVSKQ